MLTAMPGPLKSSVVPPAIIPARTHLKEAEAE